MADVAPAAGLAVVDFSGTLSLGAVEFATPGRLGVELRRSGLAELGIATPEVFWDALVNPTWEPGSTTGIGYVDVLTDAAVGHLAGRRDIDRATLRAAVQRFADGYFAASTIMPAWWPWLRRLWELPATAVVVATDHYAEATDRVAEQIVATGLPAAPLEAAEARTAILVANSADIGHHKRSRPFWDAVAAVVGRVGCVAAIDDFGANEPGADAYADRELVEQRRRAVTTLLAGVFEAPVVICPFAVPDDGDPTPAVDRAGGRAVAALSQSWPPTRCQVHP